MALIALVATDESAYAAFGPELQRLMAEHSVTTTAPTVPAPPAPPAPPTAPAQPAQPAETGQDAASAARAARAFYANVAKSIGVAKLDATSKAYAKTLRQQGRSVAEVASAIGQQAPVQQAPAAPAPTDPIAQMEAQLAEMRAAVAAASAPQPVQPAPQPAPTVTGIPPVGSLPANVCSQLQTWAAGLTSDRQVAVTRYAQGMSDGPALIASAYGDKLAKFTNKVNALLKG